MNGFPLTKSLMEDCKDFRKLPPSEKVYFWFLLSEFNLRGQFYKSDLEFAETLNLSEIKIRQARRKVMKLGWVNVRPGFRSRGKNVATTYMDITKGLLQNEEFHYEMPRYTYEFLLGGLRHGKMTNADLVIYVYLTYFRKKLGISARQDMALYITPKELSFYTNIPVPVKCLHRMYKNFTFKSGGHLFEFQEGYDELVFLKWATFADPSKDENNRKVFEGYKEEIRRRVEAKKATRLFTPDKLPDYYEKRIGGILESRQRDILVSMGKTMGANEVAGGINEYKKVAPYSRHFPDFMTWWLQKNPQGVIVRP